MNKKIEKILYALGFNLSFYDINSELYLLEKEIPKTFARRSVVDIGCGDGKTCLKIKKILKPQNLIGYDLSASLVKSANKKGLDAKIKDIEKENITGDLGILWGVLHHFNNPADTLKKLKNNFKSLIIRESIDDKRFFELGHKFNKEKLLKILIKAGINNYKIVNSLNTKSIIIFIDN